MPMSNVETQWTEVLGLSRTLGCMLVTGTPGYYTDVDVLRKTRKATWQKMEKRLTQPLPIYRRTSPLGKMSRDNF